MNTMIENLINGNISTARKQARRWSMVKIIAALQHEYGWTLERAFAAGAFLKTGDGFQAYCDAK